MPVAPSVIAAVGSLHKLINKVESDTKYQLEIEEILEIVEQFRQGAKNSLLAGFDSVETHGAFGYLIDRFLQDGSKQRTDEYRGSIENRSRFLFGCGHCCG